MNDIKIDQMISVDESIYSVNDVIKFVKLNKDNSNFSVQVGRIINVIDDCNCVVNILNTSNVEKIELKHILSKLIRSIDDYYTEDIPLTICHILFIEFISIIITFIYLYNFPFLLELPIFNKISVNISYIGMSLLNLTNIYPNSLLEL